MDCPRIKVIRRKDRALGQTSKFPILFTPPTSVCVPIHPFPESRVILRSFSFPGASSSTQVQMDENSLGNSFRSWSHILGAKMACLNFILTHIIVSMLVFLLLKMLYNSTNTFAASTYPGIVPSSRETTINKTAIEGLTV